MKVKNLCRKKLSEGVPALIGPWLVKKRKVGKLIECGIIEQGKILKGLKTTTFPRRLYCPKMATLQICDSTYENILKRWKNDEFIFVTHDRTPSWMKAFVFWTKNPASLIHFYTPYGRHMVVAPAAIIQPYATEVRIVIDNIILYD